MALVNQSTDRDGPLAPSVEPAWVASLTTPVEPLFSSTH
jgi:hypothetical protein